MQERFWKMCQPVQQCALISGLLESFFRKYRDKRRRKNLNNRKKQRPL